MIFKKLSFSQLGIGDLPLIQRTLKKTTIANLLLNDTILKVLHMIWDKTDISASAFLCNII